MGTYIPSYAVRYPEFQPAMRVIAAISQSDPIEVTTTFAHQYHPGLIVRLDIPPALGMEQANQKVGTIVTVPTPTTFTLDFSSVDFDAFTLPSSFPPGYNDAQVVPVGEVNSSLSQATRNILPL